MVYKIALIAGALMIVSVFTDRSEVTGDCLPCGPPILPNPQSAFFQVSAGADSIYVVGVYDPEREPFDDLNTAIEQATAADKRILIEVGGEWCVWCHILDDYIQSEKEVLSALGENFVIVKVNFDTVNRNEAFLSKYPTISGYPHIYVLEKDGSFLHSQQTDELESGRSYSRAAILRFLRKWAPER